MEFNRDNRKREKVAGTSLSIFSEKGERETEPPAIEVFFLNSTKPIMKCSFHIYKLLLIFIHYSKSPLVII